MHSNSMSACKSEKMKPLDLYIAVTGLISRRSNGAELNFARDGMKKRVALDVKNVHAKCHITVVLQDKSWDLYRVERRDMLGGAFGCFLFEGGYVGAVDE